MKLCEHNKNASAHWLKNGLRRLVRDEEGALLIFSIQIFIVMLITTGIAIDLVRQEERRMLIQSTIDRAALAAASLNQKRDGYEVVKDYLAKAGLGHLEIDPNVVEKGQYGEWKRATIKVKDRMPTLFGPLIGVTELSVAGNSQAYESVGNVEISLVLDISGSMNFNIYNDSDEPYCYFSRNKKICTGESIAQHYAGTYPTRIDMLRPAAKSFVTKMFDVVQPPSAPAGRLSISVVPYNQQVVLGTALAEAFSLSSDHTLNTCADVTKLPSTSIALSPSDTLQRTMYGDAFNYTGQYALGQDYWSVRSAISIENCPEAADANVLPFANKEQVINTMIGKLTPGGDTAIDVGARWGLALLDPAAQPALSTLKTKGTVSNELVGRPLAYDDGTKDASQTSMKVLVLMTDGQNTRSYSLDSPYRSGPSPFYSTASATTFSATDTSKLLYYVEGRSAPWYSFAKKGFLTATEAASATYSNRYQISWETVWSKGYTAQYVVQTFLYPPLNKASGSNTIQSIYDSMAVKSEFADKDAALNDLCTTAKEPERNIRIFTVAVDAPPAGKAILASCATGPAYAYDVAAEELTNTFSSIASAINALRLTN